MRTIERHREAVSALLTAALRPGEELLDLADAVASDCGDRVLAVDVAAAIDVPPFDNSQMDGYAIRSSDLMPGTAYPLTAEVPAGTVPRPLTAGCAAPIMTGAPMPPGADAVVPVEQTGAGFAEHAAHGTVSFPGPVAPGTFVRRRGSDIAAGSVLLPAGTVLGAAQLGALVAAGVSAVRVRALPRVALVTTGLELAPPGTALEAGRIHDSNSIMLAHALRRSGADVTVHGYHSDEPSAFLDLLSGLAATSDLLVTTGAVSRGTREVVREVLEGDAVTFDSVSMQPGGPQGLGRLHTPHGAVPVVCFPGNPVSAMVSFEMFLRPVLRRLTGRTPVDRQALTVPLAHPVDPLATKHQVRRGVLDAEGNAHVLGGAGSHLLTAYARSTVLIHLPAGPAPLTAGTSVDVWRIDD
ncbi:gephyrin-like molybdotransferase Glp [Mycetocola sp. 2940]|uniref:molybdopterin molybdotransferase MoeA n=1 Tax=Mycetocola sp. 2940 TaxID=3156452 RepID=UPI0033920C71